MGGACYNVDVLAALLVPDLGTAIHGFVIIPSAVAEIWMVGYLLAIGVKTTNNVKTTKAVEPDERFLAPA